MEIKDFIRQRRVDLSISQAELAERLSLHGEETSPARVGHWETGRNKPPLHEVHFRRALATSLEVDVNEMMNLLGFIVTDDDRSEEARLAAEIVDNLPPMARALALDYLGVLQKRFVGEN